MNCNHNIADSELNQTKQNTLYQTLGGSYAF